ncbi:MAG: OmpH family outer membrane protein [Alistipes onderdonkii]
MTACGTKTTETAAEERLLREVGSSDIAYVQVEAVLAQCDLFLNEGAALQEKTQKAQKSWAQKEQNLQAEAAQLQEKYQKGLITTNDAQAQQQSIEKRVASYQSSAQKEAQALDEENYVFTNRAQDLLHRAVQEINGDKKYKLIINATALIDADSTLNITPAVLAKSQRALRSGQESRQEIKVCVALPPSRPDPIRGGFFRAAEQATCCDGRRQAHRK